MAEENQNQEAPQPNGQAPATPPAGALNPDKSPQQETVPYARFKEINDELATLKEAAALAAKDREAEDERKKAEQGEWQKLAEGRKAKVEELTPKAELADKLTAMVTEQYQAEIKDWPETVRNMAPSDDASILTKLEWANKARALANELMEDKTPAYGNGRRPTPVSAATVAKNAEEQRTTWQKTANRRYRG